ncbi:Endoribonuclease YSH1 [Clarias magur]|uniref:Endoribonuclease YSH1 n=1 Tax=Clarias magur TaxID=1594786 RepID=A0A8J4TB15_CLAMG|nr:Endoribonuclease YSH1 [Clarias magur]
MRQESWVMSNSSCRAGRWGDVPGEDKSKDNVFSSEEKELLQEVIYIYCTETLHLFQVW